MFHNGSNYDYHFMTEPPAREFGGFRCFRENTEKYITFSVPIRKKLDNSKEITYRLKFIDSNRFMQASLSSLVDNLSGINSKEPENNFTDSMRSMIASLSQSIDKVSEIDKKVSKIDSKEPENNFTDSMRSMIASLSQSIDKVSEIDKKISKIDNKEPEDKSIVNAISINKAPEIKLIEQFPNTYQLCNKNFNQLALLLRKGVYPYEYMCSWEGFNEDSLPPKKCFYDELNKKDIAEEDYAHAQKVWEVFKIKSLG